MNSKYSNDKCMVDPLWASTPGLKAQCILKKNHYPKDAMNMKFGKNWFGSYITIWLNYWSLN